MTTSGASIEGVHIQPLKLLPNNRGRLMEVQRADDPNFPGFGQAYITSTYPGVVKAWYRHHRQIDQIAVVSGLLQLVLYDPRESSKTTQRTPSTCGVICRVTSALRSLGGASRETMWKSESAIGSTALGALREGKRVHTS